MQLTNRIARHVGLCLLLLLSRAAAQEATQTINLANGWTAVWLEVAPTYADDHPTKPGQAMSPEDAFGTAANTAILTIASPKPLSGLADFFGDAPTTETGTFNQEGWELWKKTPVVTNTLRRVTGNRAYLIQTNAAISGLQVTGKVRFFRPTWAPDRYNLVGFGINGSISFTQFFAAANAAVPTQEGFDGPSHPLNRIYSLNAAGNWSVVNPASNLESDRAYWIFSDGTSDYMGPVAIDFDGAAASGRLNFGGPGDAVAVGSASYDLEELVVTNLDGSPPTLTLTLFSAANELSLREISPRPASLDYEEQGTIGASFTMPASTAPDAPATAVLTIGADAARNWPTGRADRTRVYRLSTGTSGAAFWLPIRALQNDLQLPGDELGPPDLDNPAAMTAGLWVGEVLVDQSTSIVEDGSPSRPTSGVAPLRLLLHSNADGSELRLLSQVTLMQTRSADASVPSAPVLVVDPAQIPFFEGVKERNGKRVGLRIDSVAIDMPRQLDPAAQAALVAAATALDENSTEQQLLDYLIARSGRPPALAEAYHLTWPLEGALGAGKTIQTGAKPLNLDPFHRANPFRHAFHQQHTTGPNIGRSITITFHAEQPVSGQLRGSYQETLSGVIKTDLHLTGSITLRRVSQVASLEGS